MREAREGKFVKKSTFFLFGGGCVGTPLSFGILSYDKSPFWFLTLFVIVVAMALVGGYYWISGDEEEVFYITSMS